MNTKTTLILAVVGAIVALYLFLVDKPWETAEAKKDAPVAKALFEKKPEGIDRVELVMRDGKRAFRKQADGWVMTEPIQAPANEFEVTDVINTISDLKYEKEYRAGDKDRPKDATSGLDRPAAVVRLLKGDKVEAELAIGSRLPTGKGSYFRLAGTEFVRESGADLSRIFNKRLENYRNKQVVKFDMKDVQRVKVEGAQNFVLVKSGENWLIESPVRSRADRTKAENIVRPLSNLYVQDWKEDAPSSYKLYQLDPPRLKVTVETLRQVPAKYPPGDAAATRPADTQPSSEPQTYVLMIGGPTETAASSYFARLDSAPWVFSLGDSTFKDLAPALGELQDKTLAKIDQAKVKKVELTAGGESMTVSSDATGQWKFADGTQADTSMVEELVKSVADLKATNFADPKTQLLRQDWARPRAKVSITQEGQLEPVTILVGDVSASGRMVYVKNAAEEPVAAVNEDLVERLLLPPVSYRDRLVLTLARERVSRIEVERPGAPAVTLTKTDNKWSMATPVQAPADNDAIRNILSDLSSLQAKRVAGVGDRAKFGLDKPEVSLAVWVDPVTALPNAKVVSTQPAVTQPAGTQPASTQPSAATKPTTAELLEYTRNLPNANPAAVKMLEEMVANEKAAATQPGAATQPAVAATQPATPPQPTVYRLLLTRKDEKVYGCFPEGQMIWELDARLYEDATAEVHDRQITRFEVANVVDLSFEQPEGAVALRKSGEEWRYLPDPLVPIDKQKVTDVLNGLRELKTHRFVDYAAADLAKYGLASDTQGLVIGLDTGERTEIRLSKAGPSDDPDKSRYAMLAGSKKVFLLKDDQVKKFSQKLADFEKADKPAAPDTASMPPGGPGGPMPAGF